MRRTSRFRERRVVNSAETSDSSSRVGTYACPRCTKTLRFSTRSETFVQCTCIIVRLAHRSTSSLRTSAPRRTLKYDSPSTLLSSRKPVAAASWVRNVAFSSADILRSRIGSARASSWQQHATHDLPPKVEALDEPSPLVRVVRLPAHSEEHFLDFQEPLPELLPAASGRVSARAGQGAAASPTYERQKARRSTKCE